MKKKIFIVLAIAGAALTAYYSLKKGFDNIMDNFNDEEESDDFDL